MDINKNNSFETATGVIQKLLYDKPLYNYIDDANVNILVFGFSQLCQRFIDIAFEVSQVNGFKLNITVISNIIEAKDLYLNNRPAFSEFFDVDNNSVNQSYGKLSFVTNESNDTIENFLTNNLLDAKKKYSYVFIDYDNDKTNYSIAKTCDSCRDLLDYNFIIHFAAAKPRKTNKYLNIVLRDDTIENHKDYTKLKRMALNCHLVWNSKDDIDIRKLQREFNANYNFLSSFNNILSIKYKLNSVGIDFDSTTAAEQFYNIVESKKSEDKTKIASLVQAEHKRWNVDMICNGWQTQKDLNNCLYGVKDKKNKLHPCIVRSSTALALSELEWKKSNNVLWDSAEKKELASLDDLDKMSVKLHRFFKKKADEIKKENLLSDNDISEIHKLLANYKKADAAFKKYILCLQEINSGSKAQTRLYDYYKVRLNKELLNVPQNISKLVNKRVSTIESIFYPVLESEKYIDYKSYDKDLITKIPFILTYKTTIHLGLPLGIENDGVINNQILFQNVASTLLINPSRVTYFYNYDSKDDNKIISALQYIVNCMDSHNLRTSINICLFISNIDNERFLNTLKELSDRINHIDVISYDDEDDLENKLADYIKTRRFTALEKNNSKTTNLLYGMRCYRNNPHFEYDNLNNKLTCSNGCEYLKYICFTPHLKISDLFEFRNSLDTTELPDLQQDYEYFWSLYKKRSYKSESIWKALCNALSVTNDKENVLSISISKNDANSNKNTYFIESTYIDAFNKMLNGLSQIDSKINFNTEFYANNIYKVGISAPNHVHKEIRGILSKPYLLINASDINVVKEKQNSKIIFNNLMVCKLEYETLKTEAAKAYVKCEELIGLLEEINKNNFIVNLNKYKDSEDYSFCYSSHQIKSLLTSAGRVLELYVYYKAIENGGFDEIANSIEVVWNDDNVENEFDIILTKGFRSLIVECKAQSQLKQDFYYKLDSLNRRFGINSIPIVVADTNENENHDNSANDIQRSRGKDMGIETIYKTNDIANIGNTLKSFLKNH